ncbi:hypothetical protein DRQ21_05830 [Candidatus Fermentibacteria bacterium]|nr:MAG: hypothetical protein DRQ21_05830 [Candidatus Fermentibacteria bacterium]
MCGKWGLLFFVFGIAAACTTIIVTPGASEDGSMYVTHSDDNELMDERIVYVPAADREQGPIPYTSHEEN